MKRNPVLRPALAIVPALLCLTGCAGMGGGKKNLVMIDGMTSRVEQVHAEGETSRQRVRDAVRSLQVLSSPEFKGDPMDAFESYLRDVAAAEKQAKVFRKRVEQMEDTANAFFATWEDGLEDFTNAILRNRSRERMLQTRKLYKEVEYAALPTQDAFDELNLQLRDYGVFLSHDFNQAAIASIEKDVHMLAKRAAGLDEKFGASLQAAEAYVNNTTLRGGMEPAEELMPSER